MLQIARVANDTIKINVEPLFSNTPSNDKNKKIRLEICAVIRLELFIIIISDWFVLFWKCMKYFSIKEICLLMLYAVSCLSNDQNIIPSFSL